jgi:chemotaxis protein methyltransferase CheR
MTDADCIRFLQWALPRLQLRWPGFRRVRRQVCRRLDRRLSELGLRGIGEYRRYLEAHEDEWLVLDGLTCVTISRFYRDRAFFDALGDRVLPALARARGASELRVWSAGCASGEEPYTVVLVWRFRLAHRFEDTRLRIIATDVDETMLRRARAACYPPSSMKELPPAWLRDAFVERDGLHCLRREHTAAVELARHDIRTAPPDGPFDLILCRNLAFTYFDEALQRDVCARLVAALRPGGALAVGAHERPPESSGLLPWEGARGVYRKPAP